MQEKPDQSLMKIDKSQIIDNNETKNELNISEEGVNIKDQILIKLKEVQKLRSTLSYTISDWLRNTFGCCSNSTSKEKNTLCQLASTNIFHELDIQLILTRLHEIERLKKVILNSNQLTIFDVVPPPVITTEDNVKPPPQESTRKMPQDHNDSAKLVEVYYKNYEAFTALNENTDDGFSKNLIKLLDSDIRSIFESILKNSATKSPESVSAFVEKKKESRKNSVHMIVPYNFEDQDSDILIEDDFKRSPRV